MKCDAISSAGARCRMAAMKEQRQCFIHAESTAEARKAARQRGAEHANERRAPPPVAAASVPSPTMPAVFELGTIEQRDDLAAALMRVARAAARGELDTKRARIITEALRAAELSFAAGARGDAAGGKAPDGYREATIAEMQFLVETGRLPDGIQARDEPFWVRGAPWVPPPAALKNVAE